MASTAAKSEAAKADKKSSKKRSESEGVHKEKKEKKEKKKAKEQLVQVLDEHLQASAAASMDVDESDDQKVSSVTVIRGAIVDFAKPMANDKHQKKIFKCIKKAAKSHALLRGVKEVNKALRKTAPKTPSTSHVVPGIVIVAGDISPAEVIMHLPVCCEDVNAPYIFVASRAELGAAAKTKRPTSVVMLLPEGKKAKATADGASEKDLAEYAEAYAELVKLVQKEYTRQMRGMI